MRSEFEKDDIGLVAVGFQRVGMEDFVRSKVWDASHLYVDDGGEDTTSKSKYTSIQDGLYSLMGTKRGSIFGLLKPGVFQQSSRVKQEKITGDMTTGDGMQLGGVWIFDVDGKVIFEHVQKDFTDHPKVEDVLKIARKAKGVPEQ